MDHDAEMDHILDLLEGTGMAATYTDAEGRQVIGLTSDDERVARQLAMLDADGQDALLAGLLEGVEG